MRRTRYATVSALLLTGSLLGACGGDDENGDRAGPTTITVPAPTVSDAATATTATTATARSGTTTSRGTQGAPTSTSAAATLNCQTIAFTPNSEDAASSVTATGLSCSEAEAFVRIAGQRTSSGGPPQLRVQGYRCVLVRSLQEPIPQAFYECTNGARKVTFVRT